MGDPDLAGGQTIVGLGGWGEGCVQRDTGAGAHVLHAEQKHHLCVCVHVQVSFFLVPRGQNKTSKASRLSFINANQCVWNEVECMNVATETVTGRDGLVS